METQGCHSCVCERLNSPWKHKGVTIVYVPMVALMDALSLCYINFKVPWAV